VTKMFHHIGLPTETPMPHETWVEGGRLWISNPNLHPQRVEWLRYADVPATDEQAAFRAAPHIAYTVDSLDEAIGGKEIVIEPGEIGEPPFALAAFTREDGIIVEYLQIYEGRQWFDDEV
jgi:hypothetical protein